MVNSKTFEKTQEFKAKKDKHGKLTIVPNFERKKDGSIICHMPPIQLINKFVRENK